MTVKLACALILLAGAFASAAEPLRSEVSIERFPSLVQVEISLAVAWVQQCAGSVLTNRHVLAAASCFSGDLYFPQYRRIRAGATIRGRGGEVFGVEDAVVHPNFGLLGLEADLAVVTLDDYLTFSPAVQQVAILGQGIELPEGLQVALAGWGRTAQVDETSNGNLHSLTLTVQNNENCMTQYLGSQVITENMICAGLNILQGRDFDSRDVGASLFYDNVLVGILAFGEQADDELPVVATSVGSYTEWIIETAVIN